jgi:hypothetical protein
MILKAHEPPNAPAAELVVKQAEHMWRCLKQRTEEIS